MSDDTDRAVEAGLREALAAWLDSHGEPDIEERLADAAKDWLGDDGEPWIGPDGQGRPSMADDLDAEALEGPIRGLLPLHRSDLELIETEASTAHDYIWSTGAVSKEQASAAIWSIHNLVRAALASSRSAAPDSLDVLREAILALHRPSEHIDYVGIPAIKEHVCLACPVGDGYQAWPCETARIVLAPAAPEAR